MKKCINILNITMVVFAGVFIGHGLSEIWMYKIHPEMYAMQSAPWYTSILVYGVLTLAVWIVCIVIKLILRRFINKSEDKYK